MSTTWFLAAQYNFRPIIPVDDVIRDYFAHLSREKFLRKCKDHSIDLTVVSMEGSQKSVKGIYIGDLAVYLDERLRAAKMEYERLT